MKHWKGWKSGKLMGKYRQFQVIHGTNLNCTAPEGLHTFYIMLVTDITAVSVSTTWEAGPPEIPRKIREIWLHGNFLRKFPEISQKNNKFCTARIIENENFRKFFTKWRGFIKKFPKIPFSITLTIQKLLFPRKFWEFLQEFSVFHFPFRNSQWLWYGEVRKSIYN